jgi:hypothetical protein
MVANIVYKIRNRIKMYSEKSHKEIFSEIYKNNVWGQSKNGNFYSGSGSDDEYSDPYVELIVKFVKENEVDSLVDLGCGDFRIGRKLSGRTEVRYMGVDVVPDLIRHHKEYYQTETVSFANLNIVKDRLPNGQLCLIRQVLQHLSNNNILKILEKCKKYQYLIITEHLPIGDNIIPNRDISPNKNSRLVINSGVYFDKPPFNRTVKELLSVFPKEEENSKIVTFLVY